MAPIECAIDGWSLAGEELGQIADGILAHGMHAAEFPLLFVGQRVMAHQGGFVRGQVEQGRALARAPDASSGHVPFLRYPFIPAAQRCP